MRVKHSPTELQTSHGYAGITREEGLQNGVIPCSQYAKLNFNPSLKSNQTLNLQSIKVET